METGIGKRIRQRRKELGLSQQELADRMGLKSKSTICKVECGEDNLTTPIVRKYAKALGVNPSYFMEWGDTKESAITRELYKHFSDEQLNDPETASQIMEIVNLALKVKPEVRDGLFQTLKALSS